MSAAGSNLNPSVLQNLSQGFIVIGNDFEIRFINDTAKRLLHFAPDERPGGKLWDHLPNDLARTFRLECRNVRASRSAARFEAFFQRSNIKWIDVNLSPYQDGITVLLQDITSKKEVEQKIQENHNKLVKLTEAANHILSHEEPKQILDSLFDEISDYLDLDVYFNYMIDKDRGALRLMNYSGIPEKAAKRIEWLEFGEAVCGSVARDRSKMVMEEIQSSHDERVQLVKGLGIKTYACHPLISYGKLIGTLSFGSSVRTRFSAAELELMETICNQVAMALERAFLIAELKNKNKELSAQYLQLQESEKKFRDIFTGALDGIILMDAHGTIADANPAACRKLGIKRRNLLAKNIREFLSDIKLGKTIREMNVTSKDGTNKIIEYSATKDITPGKHLIIFRDITNRKKITNALIEAKEHAERANRAKSEFLSMISHELRTPLNSILGFSQVMLDDSDNMLNETQKDRIRRILKSGRHLIHLINEILDHTQYESGKINLKIVSVNLPEMVEDCIRLLLPIAEAKGVDIRNRIVPAVKAVSVAGDPTRIKQIIINLLTNAIKYNKPNGKVTVRYHIKQKAVKVYIHDTGIGIAKDEQKHIFEPFYRIYDPEHNIEGTGIGLTLVKNFVSMMGGQVGIRSRQAAGSSIWFTLPIYEG